MNQQKIINIFFGIGVAFFAFWIFSIGYATSLQSDDWNLLVGSGIADCFYSPYYFAGDIFQRGRHIGDMLIIFPPGILANMLISVGVDPFQATKFCCAIFYSIYILGAISALSYLFCFFSKRVYFKLLFFILSIFCVPIMLYTGSQYIIHDFYYTYMAAYIGSIFISTFLWLPFAYFWAFEKEMSIFQKNRAIAYPIWGVGLYFATFSYEPTTIPLSALSLAMLLYLWLNRKKISVPREIYIFLYLFIFLSFSAFLLTYFGGRGDMQIERLSIMGNIVIRTVNTFEQFPEWIKAIFTIGMFYGVYLIIKSIRNKCVEKKVFLSISMIFIGIFCTFLFIAIVADYYLSLYFIIGGLLLPIISAIEQKKAWGGLLLMLIILGFSIKSCSSYLNEDDAYITKQIKLKQDKKLLQLFKDADKNGITEIVLEASNPVWTNYRLDNDPNGYPNNALSIWMHYHGYTQKYIGVIKK